MEKKSLNRLRKSLGQRILSSTASAVIAVTSILSAASLQAGADDKGKDGLPNLKMPYEESIWYRGNPLGVAGDFHVLAFDSFTGKAREQVLQGGHGRFQLLYHLLVRHDGREAHQLAECVNLHNIQPCRAILA